MTNIYLSICIPTNGRIEILKNTLDSIFINCKVDYSDFEVVLSDNSKDDDLLKFLENYKDYPNIIYEKTNCEGFLNSVNALKLGRGHFLKLHNNYTMLESDGLHQMVSFIKTALELKPLVFFSNGEFRWFNEKKYSSFNSFMYDLSFWCTWSTGFSIWRDDFQWHFEHKVNKMFPQTSLILLQNGKKSFIINDFKLFNNQDVSKKGGYNLFKTFGVDYLQIMEEACAQNSITLNTFKKIKHDLYYNFLIKWYYNTKIAKNDFTYDLTNIKSSISVYYTAFDYYRLVVLAYFFSFYRLIRSALSFF